MPPLTVTIPSEFKYVGAVCVLNLWLLVKQHRAVMYWREKSGIWYPRTYAEKAEMEASRDAHMFNCAQRAHQNTLENLPILYVTAVVAGLRYPILTATLTGSWVIGKIAFTNGYATGDPDKRFNKVYAIGGLSLVAQGLIATGIALEWAFGDLATRYLKV
ncbi:hypothetical protein D9611_005711 [Ephemerocybe angulata]|uniref:Uncharacterized protein n=2 Tax=Ephemerocybe angulata TaxID=980116 RepID=A0A8H6ILJ0_9AGAR|nr:hypothetical protein D9611_005711 [Tulosesus angulatus]KAF6766606.1 hypothetical protein DFP72DRAFT_867113 [Tulosesus angulatus]